MKFRELDLVPATMPTGCDSPRCALGYVAVSKGQAVAMVTTAPHEWARVLAGWIVPYVNARDLFVAAREIRAHCAASGWLVWDERDALEAIERIVAKDLADELIAAASQ